MPNHAEQITQSAETFYSGDKPISLERFESERPGKRPAILVLHGADGFRVFGKALYQQFAREQARNGFVAYLIRYFDRTDTRVGDEGIIRENFAAWLGTVSDAIGFVADQPNVDSARIGLFGVSLGASLALALATQDERIGAVVDYFGALPAGFVPGLKRMPPTLILHGAADQTVPVREAYKLEKLFREKHLPYEITIYPNQGHGFRGSEGKDALHRATAFFTKHLNT